MYLLCISLMCRGQSTECPEWSAFEYALAIGRGVIVNTIFEERFRVEYRQYPSSFE